jgi:anti-sigma28 factor (negative regulator of flagellin synthesis)
MDRPIAPPVNDSKVSPIERRKRIAALKKSVSDGTYKVSAEQLADKLIDHMLEPEG